MIAAASGQDCLRLAEKHKPNLILLDVFMPVMDGWEVARRLRESAGERAAIILLSANAVDKAHEFGPNRLHDDYLMKPFDLRQLLGENSYAAGRRMDIRCGERPASTPNAAGTAIDPALAIRDIEDLMHLAQIGYVRGIQHKLTEIERDSRRIRPLSCRCGRSRTVLI